MVVFYPKIEFLQKYFSFFQIYEVRGAGIWLNENLFDDPQTCPEGAVGSVFMEGSFFFILTTIMLCSLWFIFYFPDS